MGGNKNIKNSSEEAFKGNNSALRNMRERERERKRKMIKDRIQKQNMQKIEKINKKQKTLMKKRNDLLLKRNELLLKINNIDEEMCRNEEEKKNIKINEESQLH